MAQPFFSVLIPVYNAENYLDECLSALIEQPFGDFEAVLVNDGSKDGSGAICDRWAQRYPEKIRVLHQENRGVTVTREVCLRASCGRYIISVDSDDVLHRDAMTVLHDYITRYDADVVLYKVSTEPDFPSPLWEFPFADGDVMDISSSHRLRQLMGATFCLNNLSTKAFLRELAVDGWDSSAIAHIQQGEDLVHSLGIMDRARRVVFCDSCLYYYRLNPNSITHTYKSWLFRSMRDAIAIQRSYAEKWDPTGALAADCDRNALENFYDVMVKIMLSSLPRDRKRELLLEMLEDKDFIRDYAYIRRVESAKKRLSLMLAKHRIFAPLYLYGDVKRMMKK